MSILTITSMLCLIYYGFFFFFKAGELIIGFQDLAFLSSWASF